MKTKFLFLIAFFITAISIAQTKYSLKGTSEIFVLEDVSGNNDPDIDYPSASVFVRIENNKVKFRIKTTSDKGNSLGRASGYDLAELRDPSDLVPVSFDAVQTWFRDNTGKSKASSAGGGDVTTSDLNTSQSTQDATIAATYLPSILTGEPAGSERILNIVRIDSASYATAKANQTLVSTTWYVIPEKPGIEDFADVYLDRQSIDPSVTVDGNAITTWEDLTSNGLDATVTGAVTLDITGGERNVQTDGGYLSFPSNALFQKTLGVDTFAIAWREGDVIPAGGTIVSKAVATAGDREWSVYYNNVDAITVNANGSEANTNISITSGTERLFVLEFGTTTFNLRVDGVDVISDATLFNTPRSASAQVMNIFTRTSGGFQATSGSHLSAFVFVSDPTAEQISTIESQLQIN